MPPPNPSPHLRRFYSLFYTYCRLQAAPAAHHVSRHHPRSFAVSRRAHEGDGYRIRRSNRNPQGHTHIRRGQNAGLRSLPIQNSSDRSFDGIKPWDGAMRWKSEAGCMYEICLPVDAIEALRKRYKSHEIPLLKKETGARVEVGETSERNGGRERVVSVLVSGSFDEVERVREVLRKEKGGGNALDQAKAKGTGKASIAEAFEKRNRSSWKADWRHVYSETSLPFAEMCPWTMRLRTKPSKSADLSPVILDFAVPIPALQRLQQVYTPDLSSLRAGTRAKCEITFPAHPHPEDVQLLRLTGPESAVKATYDFILALRPRLEDHSGNVAVKLMLNSLCERLATKPAKSGSHAWRATLKPGKFAVVRRYAGDDMVADVEVMMPVPTIEALESAASGQSLAEILLTNSQTPPLRHAEVLDGVYLANLDCETLNLPRVNPLVEGVKGSSTAKTAMRPVALRGSIEALAQVCFRLMQTMRKHVAAVERELSEAFVPGDAVVPQVWPKLDHWLRQWKTTIGKERSARMIQQKEDQKSFGLACSKTPSANSSEFVNPTSLPTPLTIVFPSSKPELEQSIVLVPVELLGQMAGHRGKNLFAIRKISGVHSTHITETFEALKSTAGKGAIEPELSREVFEKYGAAVVLKGGAKETRIEAAVMVRECLGAARNVVEWRWKDRAMEEANEVGKENEVGREMRWDEEETAARYFAADAEQDVDKGQDPLLEQQGETQSQPAQHGLATRENLETTERPTRSEQHEPSATAANLLPPFASAPQGLTDSPKPQFIHARLLLHPNASRARRAEIHDLLIGHKGVWVRRIQWQSLCLLRSGHSGMGDAADGKLFVVGRRDEDVRDAIRRVRERLEVLGREGWLTKEEVEGAVVVEEIWQDENEDWMRSPGEAAIGLSEGEGEAFETRGSPAVATSTASPSPANFAVIASSNDPTSHTNASKLKSNLNVPRTSPLPLRHAPDIYPQTTTLETFNAGHFRVHYPDIPPINFQGVLLGHNGKTLHRIQKTSGLSSEQEVRITNQYIELRGPAQKAEVGLALTREVIERAIILHDRQVVRPELWQKLYREELDLLPGCEQEVRQQALDALVGKNWMVLERIKVKTLTAIQRGNGRFAMLIEGTDELDLAKARREIMSVVRTEVFGMADQEGSDGSDLVEGRPLNVQREREGEEQRVQMVTQEIHGEGTSRKEEAPAAHAQTLQTAPAARSSSEPFPTSSNNGLTFRPSPILQASYRPVLYAHDETAIYRPLRASYTNSQAAASAPSSNGNNPPRAMEDTALLSSPKGEQFVKIRLLPQSSPEARAALDEYLLADGAKYITRIEQQTNTSISKLARHAAGEYILAGLKETIGRAKKLLVSRARIKVQMMQLPAEETMRMVLDIRARPRDEEEAEAQRVMSTAEDVKAVSRRLTHPVVLITSYLPSHDLNDDEPKEGIVLRHCRGVTVSSFTTVTLTPLPVVTFNLKVPSRTWEAIEQSGRFCAHVMAATPEAAGLTTAFTMPHKRAEKPFVQCLWMGAKVEALRHAPPRIKLPGSVLARLECWVMQEKCITVGDHVVVVAAVRWVAFPGEARDFSREEVIKKMEGLEGLSYADRKYRRLGREIEAVKVPRSGSRELQAKRKEKAQLDEAVEARAKMLEEELLGGLPDEGDDLGPGAGQIGVEEEEYDFGFGPEDRKRLDEQVGDITKPARPYDSPTPFGGKRQYHTSAVRRQQRDDKDRNIEPDPAVAHETLEQFLGETGTFRSRGRMRALIKAKRASEDASHELQSALADGSLTHERSLELENVISTNERRVDKKLALRAAGELTRMLDTGRVDVRRAQWLESAVEKGMVVVRDEVERVKTAVEEKRLDAETFARVREGLSKEWSMLSEAALRLREMSDVDSFDD